MHVSRQLFALSVALVFAAVGCSDEGSNVPTELSFAKGGKPGKTEPVLTEYWVLDNVIHIAGTGNVDEVKAYVAHDFNSNAAFDDNYSLHYEYFHPPPPRTAVTSNPDGTFSVEIPWNGERELDGTLFRDFVVTADPDPFVFWFVFISNDRVVAGFEPQGIIGAAPPGATSYATFQGEAPDGFVYVTDLGLTGLSCEIAKRRGKKVTRLTGSATATVAGTTVETPDVWVEFHYIVDSELLKGFSSISSNGVIQRTETEVFEGERSSLDVGLLLDYVYPQLDVALAYDPSLDEVPVQVGPFAVNCQ